MAKKRNGTVSKAARRPKKASKQTSSSAAEWVSSDLAHPLWKDYSKLREQYGASTEGAKKFLREANRRNWPKATRLDFLASAKADPRVSHHFYAQGERWPWTFYEADGAALKHLAGQAAVTLEELLDCIPIALHSARPPIGGYESPRIAEIHPKVRSLIMKLSRDETAALVGATSSARRVYRTPWENAKARAHNAGREDPDAVDSVSALLTFLERNRGFLEPDFDLGCDRVITVSHAAFQYPDLLYDDTGGIRASGVTTLDGQPVTAAIRDQCCKAFKAAREQWALLQADHKFDDVPATTKDTIRQFLSNWNQDGIGEACVAVLELEARVPHRKSKRTGRKTTGKRKRGRPVEYNDREDAQRVASYQSSGQTVQEYARSIGIDSRDLVKTVDRVRQREKRGNK